MYLGAHQQVMLEQELTIRVRKLVLDVLLKELQNEFLYVISLTMKSWEILRHISLAGTCDKQNMCNSNVDKGLGKSGTQSALN